MQDLNDKITGNTLTATEWNEVPSEIQNVIEGLGQTLSSGDLDQLGKGIAGYVANGVFYTDSGIADAYVLAKIGSKQAPTAYADGFSATFSSANVNTGASTVNIAGLGVKNIKLRGGNNPGAFDIAGIVSLVFDSSNDWFELINPNVTGSVSIKNTIADAKGDDEFENKIGGYVRVSEFSTGVQIDALYLIQAAGTGTADGGLVHDSTTSSLFQLKLVAQGGQAAVWGVSTTDCTVLLQNSIDALTPGLSGGGTIVLDYGKNYITSGVGIVVPPNVTLDCRAALTTYTGTGVAFTLGNSDTVLSYRPRLINCNIKLQDKDSDGARLRGTVSAELSGQMEGHTSVFDNTRSNVGVDVDGVDISSFFNDIHDIYCNHMHEGLRVWSTGTSFPTAQYIKNFNVNGDQATDTTSVGINWAPSGSGLIGEGSVIMGGYVEKSKFGIKVGSGSGQVSVHGLRFETIADGASPKITFAGANAPWHLFGLKGLGTSYMGAADGILGFGNAANTFTGDESGSLRLAGMDKALNATNFIALGGAAPQIWFKDNADAFMLTDSDGTGTGRIGVQCGKGSAAHGAGYIAHGGTHATNPGEMHLFGASSKDVSITNGLGGVERAKFTMVPAAGTTNFYLYDADNATLEQVSVGAADSGGAGFKVLRIPN